MTQFRAWKGRKLLGMERDFDYALKGTEWRKERIIRRHCGPGCCLDLACGPGEYGPILQDVCGEVWGLDIEQALLDQAEETGSYARLVRESITDRIPFEDNAFTNLWASEILEHFPDLGIVDEFERIATTNILITVPNPISPHFKEDETHILEYSVASFQQAFGARKKFRYSVQGLGFNEIPLNLPLRKLSTLILQYIPKYSPTIAVIGRATT
jgi:ubiquinone/menaquinone biosynthesis C-methylase UbiE